MGAEDAIDLIDPRSRIFGDHIQRRLIDRARVQGSELRGFTGVQSPESRILSPDSDSRVQSPESTSFFQTFKELPRKLNFIHGDRVV